MIDTDKYEGYTKEHWTWMGEEVFVDNGFIAPTIARIISNNRADANLIADAPLLLAEVIRLREQFRLAYDWVDYQLPDGGMRDFAKYIGEEEE